MSDYNVAKTDLWDGLGGVGYGVYIDGILHSVHCTESEAWEEADRLSMYDREAQS